MRRLRDFYQDDPRTAALRGALAGDRDLVIGALPPALAAVLLAAVASDGGPGRLVVCPEPKTLAEDLEELGVRVAVLPELERFNDEDEDGGDATGHAKRAAALEAFATGSWLITDAAAADQPVPDLAELARSSLILKPGQQLEPHALLDRLVEAGYRVATEVEGRGQIAQRGGIVDVFPWIGADALRIDFFGDEIDAIRRFDPLTQESIGPVEQAVLARGGGGLAVKPLWPQLPAGPLVILGDLPLRGRLKTDHGRREIRLARVLESGAVDGAGTTVERLRGDLQRGLTDLSALHSEGLTIRLLARNDEAVRELQAHLADADLSGIEVTVGRLSAGFRDQERGFLLGHDFELAARQAVRRRSGRVAGGEPLSGLDDLRAGDLVVHLRHGIARFRGVATLEKRGYLEDYLLLEFAQGSKLYVPVDAIDLVQRYVGATGRNPDLSTLGGPGWAKKREKAEKAIADMSGELLVTQAQRLARGGWPCPADGPEVRRFEAAFPYEETEDQLAAVREIKADLERPVAMDRLLCGDVGFGKTEVAMRAAYKIAASGKQVAVLAPTTLLAEQHLENFKVRMPDLRIEGINRFRSGKERSGLIAKAAEGTVDILVGTHALLSEKIVFKDLGLIVIDEEHRFGVKQKEKLKAVAPTVHVLALSATPIPRTLHFSLLGIRDISVLAEAPAERLAVETRVAPWEDELVRHALQRERERQGQIFVIHHRIDDLDQIAWRLGKLAPGLKLDTVHGRMDEERIGRVMDAFRCGQLECLVATSIIESGIDIPNANTLIVTDASHFGLAELHQIRGRIGRFTRQAHAYFLTPPRREIGEEARERLNAIQEYAELGAGFKLAMRDLELRGAGNLLGAEQSGQIDAIGYELYTKLLGEAVAKAKAQAAAAAGLPPPPPAPVAPPALPELGMAVDAYIPDDWLETAALRFDLHRRLDKARRLSDLEAAARQARDRYGALPAPVARLFLLRAIRLRLPHLGIEKITVEDRQIQLRLRGAFPKELAAVSLPELVHIQPGAGSLVLFLRKQPDQDQALRLLARLFALDLAFLGEGW